MNCDDIGMSNWYCSHTVSAAYNLWTLHLFLLRHLLEPRLVLLSDSRNVLAHDGNDRLVRRRERGLVLLRNQKNGATVRGAQCTLGNAKNNASRTM